MEKLLTLAKENGIEITEEQAKEYFAQIKTLSDEELEAVAGGLPLNFSRIPRTRRKPDKDLGAGAYDGDPNN